MPYNPPQNVAPGYTVQGNRVVRDTGSSETRGRESNVKSQKQVRKDINAQAKDFEKRREKALGKGLEKGRELFSDDLMGYKPKMDELLDLRRQQMQGFTPEERSLLNDQYLSGLRQSEQAQALEQRRLGSQLRGPAAAAQALSLQKDQAKARAGMQRELFLKESDMKRQALGNYENTLASNLSAENKNKLNQMATMFGYGSLNAADQATATQSVLGQQMATAQQNAASGGKK